eukprot:SAG11_NODE_1008_length_6205_cov_3.939240_5_plen_215_part_00
MLVSGSTLCFCFLCMLLIPVSTISTMGIGAAVAVALSLCLALTLTPTLLLTFPGFFTARRRLGLTLDGLGACFKQQQHDASAEASSPLLSPAEGGDGGSLRNPAAAGQAALPPPEARSRWAAGGKLGQRAAPLAALVLLGIAVPFLWPLSRIGYVEGLVDMLPAGQVNFSPRLPFPFPLPSPSPSSLFSDPFSLSLYLSLSFSPLYLFGSVCTM